MKVAIATKQDLDCLSEIAGILSRIERGDMPGDEDEFFNSDDREQCRNALKMIMDANDKGNVFRALANLFTVLDPANEVIDPDSETLELHPKWSLAVLQKDMLAKEVMSWWDEHKGDLSGYDGTYNHYSNTPTFVVMARSIIESRN